MEDVICKDEEMIGYAQDIIRELRKQMAKMVSSDRKLDPEEFTTTIELINALEHYDDDLVICYYHPMGAWCISKLVREEE